jgi:hypothetical protein
MLCKHTDSVQERMTGRDRVALAGAGFRMYGVALTAAEAGRGKGRASVLCSRPVLFTALALAGASAAIAATMASGTAVTHRSPHGLEERCLILDRMPGGIYSDADRTLEKAFCSIDFYSGNHALCPKVFSTSPGTLVYDLSRGPFAGDSASFEAEQCASGSPVKRGAPGEPVSFKMTMNDADTSATFSTAALLYYHFARYFNADVHVPVSVYRSMDKDEHRARVTRLGLDLSARRKGGAMNHAGWNILQAAENNPPSYRATDELFTPDRKQVYGVLLQPHGDRYGPEFNGTRQSGWGEGQNRDFQETPPFQALRSALPLVQAIDAGINAAAANPTLRQAMRSGIAPEQMVFWMKELTEITLLDYIFSQQDRIGNIDYLTYWYWVDNGQIRRMPASGTQLPEAIADQHAIRLRRSQLNDNDAGGRIPYANYTKKTRMLENIRHYNADTYRRLQRLAADFEARGELYAYVRDSFGLSKAQLEQAVKNTRLAAGILRDSCRAGRLRFDLDPAAFLLSGKAEQQQLDCDKPEPGPAALTTSP